MASVGTAEVNAWERRGRELARAPESVPFVGAVLGLAAVVESFVATRGSGATGALVALLCCVALATALPAAVRRASVAATAGTAGCVLSLAAFETLTVAGLVAQVLVAYRLGHARWSPAATALGLPYLVLALMPPSGARTVEVLLAAAVPAATLAGLGRRTRRGDAEGEAAARAVAGTLLEHGASRERARIARELHDVVAHHLSMISVQAETARLTTPGMPAAGAQRLSAIGDTARAALTEMRRLLGVLREDFDAAAPPGPAPVDRQPQPGLRQLNALLDEARDAAGTGTRLILNGAPSPLDPGVELAVYRIVQEALTNARRHAPGAAVDVELHYTPDALRLLVRDNGPGTAPGSSGGAPGGHGLLGMHERAAAVGGRLRAGEGSGGGFLVEATLPRLQEDL